MVTVNVGLVVFFVAVIDIAAHKNAHRSGLSAQFYSGPTQMSAYNLYEFLTTLGPTRLVGQWLRNLPLIDVGFMIHSARRSQPFSLACPSHSHWKRARVLAHLLHLSQSSYFVSSNEMRPA